jgi:hypothetical protein
MIVTPIKVAGGYASVMQVHLIRLTSAKLNKPTDRSIGRWDSFSFAR